MSTLRPVDPGEPELPYTPSNTGRRARVGYLGFDGVGFNDLWPVFAGLVVSIGLGLRFFVAEPGGASHWVTKTAEAALPLAAGIAYLRLLVVGRPPHFKGDLWVTATGLRVDFTDPPLRAFPILPRLVFDSSAACGPGRAADERRAMHGRVSR